MATKAAYAFEYDRSKVTQKDKSKPGLIQIRVTLNRKRKWFSTGIYVLSNQWHPAKLIIKHPNANKLNQRLKMLLKKLEDQELQALDEIENELRYQPFSIDELQIEDPEEKERSLTNFWEKKFLENPAFRKETYKNYKSALHKLQEFKSEVYFHQVNYQFLKAYENFLINYRYKIGDQYKPLSKPRVHQLLKVVKTVLLEAIRCDLFPHQENPFIKFKLSSYKKAEGNTTRKFLEPGEILKIETLSIGPGKSHLEEIRDFFILQVYTGLAYKDMIRLSRKEISYRDNGEMYIKMKRGKSDEEFYVPVSKMFMRKPEMIIKKYLARYPDRPYIFDQYSNQHINRELKKIAKMAGVNKFVSTHVGRHSCATWLISLGASFEVVQKILGHADVRTTQIYGKTLNQAVDRARESITFDNL